MSGLGKASEGGREGEAGEVAFRQDKRGFPGWEHGGQC